MGIDRGVAGAAFATPVLPVGTARFTNKIRGLDTKKKCLKKIRDKTQAKKQAGMHKIAPFFQNFSGTAQSSIPQRQSK